MKKFWAVLCTGKGAPIIDGAAMGATTVFTDKQKAIEAIKSRAVAAPGYDYFLMEAQKTTRLPSSQVKLVDLK